ncbi:MAG TPA: glycosyltransferase family 2 protein [Bacilli bacterium]|nr:glycosyltransferase family 2 protein [Bacilli bacterium]
MLKEKEITFLLPCLNEESTIVETIIMIKKYINRTSLNAEILVVDNRCTDSSIRLAKENGARIVKEEKKGYGNALIKGFKESKGKYIIMGDCDTTYDFSNVDIFIEKLEEGYDLVIGNRYKGGIEKGAMSFLHKYIGVPILSKYAKKKYKININDFHCGLRGINRKEINNFKFESEGMELATEMIYCFAKNNKKIIEVPTVLKKCINNKRKSHLNTFKDGYRHLKFIYKSKM